MCRHRRYHGGVIRGHQPQSVISDKQIFNISNGSSVNTFIWIFKVSADTTAATFATEQQASEGILILNADVNNARNY